MSDSDDKPLRISRLQSLLRALDEQSLQNVPRLVNSLHPGEIAHLLESLPPAQREVVWDLVDPSLDGEVLVNLNEEVRYGLIEKMDTAELVSATAGLDTDDLVDLLQDLPGALTDRVLASMDLQDRQRIESVLSFAEDTAGGLMDPNVVTVRPELTIQVVLRYLRVRGDLPPHTDALYVVNRDGRYLGLLPLTVLLMLRCPLPSLVSCTARTLW